MTEYEELITNLRNCAMVNSLSHYKRDLMKQAADAIEELSKQTNADRIRQMSDEELANFFWQDCGMGNCPPVECKGKICKAEKCWLDWLKQEASE